MRRSLSIPLAAALLLCGTAAAQEPEDLSIRPGALELGAFGTLSMPIADYGDLAKFSGGVGILFGYYPGSRFAFGLDAGGHWHGATDEANRLKKDSTGSPDAELKFRLYRFTPYAKFLLKEGGVAPYVSVLAGLYMQEARLTASGLGSPPNPKSTTITASQGYLGAAVGLGLQYNSPESIAAFIDARIHEAVRDGATPLTLIDVRVGVAFLL